MKLKLFWCDYGGFEHVTTYKNVSSIDKCNVWNFDIAEYDVSLRIFYKHNDEDEFLTATFALREIRHIEFV